MYIEKAYRIRIAENLCLRFDRIVAILRELLKLYCAVRWKYLPISEDLFLGPVSNSVILSHICFWESELDLFFKSTSFTSMLG